VGPMTQQSPLPIFLSPDEAKGRSPPGRSLASASGSCGGHRRGEAAAAAPAAAFEAAAPRAFRAARRQRGRDHASGSPWTLEEAADRVVEE
jgi:hypothetical protein